MTKGESRLVLVVRGAHGRHAHQLSLPGGKHEPDDASFLETVLRETEEEIGLARAEVEVIAALPAIDTRTTGFRVHPYLARIRPRGSWRLAQGEITRVNTQRVRGWPTHPCAANSCSPFRTWAEPRRVQCLELEDGCLLWRAHGPASRTPSSAATERRVRNLSRCAATAPPSVPGVG
jgi:hypothetical protein